MFNPSRFRMLSLIGLISSVGCAAAVAAPSDDQTGIAGQAITVTMNPNAVAYNTPGPQYDDAGVPLGTYSNPFALISMQKFADPTHQDNWAVDPLAEYGTFHQAVVLGGTLQYKWLKCGAVGAGC